MDDNLEQSAGMAYALPDKLFLPASALSAETAASQAGALREVMKILEQPAWSSLLVVRFRHVRLLEWECRCTQMRRVSLDL